MKASGKAERPRLWSTRNPSWLPLEGAAGDLITLEDGTLVAALEVHPVDTALMSQEEVHGYISRYWQGLRSLHFPVGIYIGTRRQNVASYLERATERLDELAESRDPQDGFFGMLLEEQCRLLGVLLAEHLRSRYTLLVVSQNLDAGLRGAAKSLVRARDNNPAPSGARAEARAELELKVKKVEDIFHHVGLKYTRWSGKQLAGEILRLSRPDLLAEEAGRLESRLEPEFVVRAEMKGGDGEDTSSLKG